MTSTETPDPSKFTQWAFVCHASDCRARGAQAVTEALAKEVQVQGSTQVGVVRSGCLSLCGAGPALVTYPSGDVHLHVQAADAHDLAGELAAGRALKRRAVRAPKWYTDYIVARLGQFVQLLRRRHAPA